MSFSASISCSPGYPLQVLVRCCCEYPEIKSGQALQRIAGAAVDIYPSAELTEGILVIEVSDKALINRDYLITVNDITAWEKENGSILRDVIVFFRAGYGKYYPDAAQYFGTAEKGDSVILNYTSLAFIPRPPYGFTGTK